MFAIFLNKGMDPFYQNIASFPTAIFTFVLALCVLYWLSAVLGAVDIDVLDINGLEADMDTGSDDMMPNAMAGIMLKFGLNGVPVTIIISFLSLFSWLISYYAVHYLSPLIPVGLLFYLFSVLVLSMAFFLSILITALILKIIRPFFQKLEQQSVKSILGKVAVVRTTKVTDSFGEAFLNDGGAGLIIKIRAANNQQFTKGDKVILLEYQKSNNVYHVVSEQEFSQ